MVISASAICVFRGRLKRLTLIGGYLKGKTAIKQ